VVDHQAVHDRLRVAMQFGDRYRRVRRRQPAQVSGAPWSGTHQRSLGIRDVRIRTGLVRESAHLLGCGVGFAAAALQLEGLQSAIQAIPRDTE